MYLCKKSVFSCFLHKAKISEKFIKVVEVKGATKLGIWKMGKVIKKIYYIDQFQWNPFWDNGGNSDPSEKYVDSVFPVKINPNLFGIEVKLSKYKEFHDVRDLFSYVKKNVREGDIVRLSSNLHNGRKMMLRKTAEERGATVEELVEDTPSRRLEQGYAPTA